MSRSNSVRSNRNSSVNTPLKGALDLYGRKKQNRASFEGQGGDSEEFYDGDWMASFDLVFLSSMLLWLGVLLFLSATYNIQYFTNPKRYWSFWVECLGKVLLESFIGFLGGLLVIYKDVKVNYVRKIQHFCAYLIPLLFASFMPPIVPTETLPIQTLGTWWGYWFLMMSFMILIFPLRSRIYPLFVMFMSMDRPEDRPHTLKWISTQVVLGYVIISGFTFYSKWSKDASENLIYIAVFTTGIGDGLAEPIGIAFGKHKYRSRALCSSRSYTRSLEGSSCVYTVAAISCAAFFHSWPGWFQFMVGILTIPLIMTFVEAFSPHTWDTPFLMGSCCLLLLGCAHIPTPKPEHALLEGLVVGIGGAAINLGIILGAIFYVKKNPLPVKEKKEKVLQQEVSDGSGSMPSSAAL